MIAPDILQTHLLVVVSARTTRMGKLTLVSVLSSPSIFYYKGFYLAPESSVGDAFVELLKVS